MHFLDTNILLYLIFPTAKDRPKFEKAAEILQDRNGVLSVQVLQEFYVQATRVSRQDPLNHEEAVAFLRTLHRFRIQENTMEVFQKALEIKSRYGISFWDASILAAAKVSGCDQVYSEDLKSNKSYDGVQVINPFR